MRDWLNSVSKMAILNGVADLHIGNAVVRILAYGFFTGDYLEEDGGNYGGLTGEQGVRRRVLELLFYIQSIQQ